MTTTDDFLVSLPNRGWALIRTRHLMTLVALDSAGFIAVHATPVEHTYQVRLTAAGRRARKKLSR